MCMSHCPPEGYTTIPRLALNLPFFYLCPGKVNISECSAALLLSLPRRTAATVYPMTMIVNILIVLGAYLLGSIPSAVWIGRRFYGVDVREHGSKNAGATNTLRVLGPRAALPVFALDVAKGFAAVMLCHLSAYEGNALINLKLILVATAVLGHIFPVFAGFRGGKGVATLAGAVLAVHPPAVLLCLATFALILILTHYVSLGSITAGCLLPVYVTAVFHERYVPLIAFCCAVSLLLLYTHRRNIRRLVQGTESKTYLIKPKSTPSQRL